MRQAVAGGRDPLEEKRQRAAGRDRRRRARRLPRPRGLRGARPHPPAATDAGRIRRHLLPLLGRKHVDKLTPEEIERAFAAIRDGKTAVDEKVGFRARARVTGGEGTARRTIRLLRAASWPGRSARASRPIPPSTSHRQRRRPRHDPRGPGAYARLFPALDAMEASTASAGRRRRDPGHRADRRAARRDHRPALAACGPPAGACSCCRRPRTRPAAKTGKPRVIGLPAAAQAIIARQPPGGPDDLVFRPSRGAGPLAVQKPWDSVRAEAELPDGIGLHGLRHSLARTWRWEARRPPRS